MISFILSLAFFALVMGALWLFARAQQQKPAHAQARTPAAAPAPRSTRTEALPASRLP